MSRVPKPIFSPSRTMSAELELVRLTRIIHELDVYHRKSGHEKELRLSCPKRCAKVTRSVSFEDAQFGSRGRDGRHGALGVSPRNSRPIFPPVAKRRQQFSRYQFAVAASRLRTHFFVFLGLTPKAKCYRHYVAANSASSKLTLWVTISWFIPKLSSDKA